MSELSEGELPDPSFFEAPALPLCRRLLGMELCRRRAKGEVVRLPIIEVEAYDGFQDRASHAHRGRTARNAAMFDRGGRWYVYLCYGVHWLMNLTAGPEGHPAAILIRGAGSIQGPGRLTKALGVDGSFDGKPVTPETGLWLEQQGVVVSARSICKTPRVGIDSAGPVWAKKPWRFVWKDAPGVKVKV